MSAKIFRLKIPKEEHALISLPIAFHFFIQSGKKLFIYRVVRQYIS